MKDLKVSNETHSQLFSIKNTYNFSHNVKFTYDDIVKLLLSYYKPDIKSQTNEVMRGMYQLEEKP